MQSGRTWHNAGERTEARKSMRAFFYFLFIDTSCILVSGRTHRPAARPAPIVVSLPFRGGPRGIHYRSICQ